MNLSWRSVFAIMHILQSLPQPSLLLNGDRTVWENCPCSRHFVWLWSHSTSCLCYSKLLCIWLDWRRSSLYLPSAPHVQLHYNSFAVDPQTQSICKLKAIFKSKPVQKRSPGNLRQKFPARATVSSCLLLNRHKCPLAEHHVMHWKATGSIM